MDIACPECGENEELRGERRSETIALTCESCGHRWFRDLVPSCSTCGRRDVRQVPLAIVEKGRGTQLSVVGTRPIHLCPGCDAETLARWQRNRPNPLMPDELPTVGDVGEALGAS
jgi:predicted RNA-binding Zn-ribbon protein involved in translation (DUF1610 family)